MTSPSVRTTIFRRTGEGEELRERLLGYVETGGTIYRLRWDEGRPVGRWDGEGRVYRHMAHDERELGKFTGDGRVRSHGLFEGGAVGWVDPDGVVVQAGLILGEEEVGRVDGPDPYAAGAALLLLFLPDEAEEDRQARRGAD